MSFDSTHHNLLYTIGLTFVFGGQQEIAARERQDSDGDGVYDYMDMCPDTPSGVDVDSSGCPRDSDGDGVYDYMDKCLGTPIGAGVDERGCWVLKGVQFDIGKATIRPESYAILDEVVDVLDKNPELEIEIQGHTDSTGSAEMNLRLSQNRAASVLEYFVSKGIERTRLSCRGFGMEKPIASNATAEGRAKNRRVELKPVQ
jgi:OOP family OmpA-OmpF porin